jgi:hypothetical protein
MCYNIKHKGEITMVDQIQLTPEQAYLQVILEKFNANPDDPTLQDVERILLIKIKEVQQTISEKAQEIEKLNAEIRERQEKGNVLVQQITHAQGQSQGYVESLLAVRKQ